MTYRDAGVDIDAGNELVERIKPLVKRSFRPEVMGGLGGFGALHQHVVDAHRHEVDADRVVALEVERQLQLGAHAVGPRNQHRLAIAFGHFEQRAETAETAEHALAQGFFGEWLDALDEGVAGIDVDAGITVGKGGLRGWLSHLGVPNEACTHGGGKIRVLLRKC